jgi:hypothetical protein
MGLRASLAELRRAASREQRVVLRVPQEMRCKVSLVHVLPIALVALVLALAGCGRKATREDCDIVVDRNVELQLKALGITDPAIIAKRREEMRGSMKEDIDKCVGKRVTDGMMACVKAADTPEKIDKCGR